MLFDVVFTVKQLEVCAYVRVKPFHCVTLCWADINIHYSVHGEHSDRAWGSQNKTHRPSLIQISRPPQPQRLIGHRSDDQMWPRWELLQITFLIHTHIGLYGLIFKLHDKRKWGLQLTIDWLSVCHNKAINVTFKIKYSSRLHMML